MADDNPTGERMEQVTTGVFAAALGEWGALLTGIGGFLGAVYALFSAAKSRRMAQRALDSSPAAILDGAMSEVRAVSEAWSRAQAEFDTERAGLEQAIERERTARRLSEETNFQLQVKMALVTNEMAGLRLEIGELRDQLRALTGRT